MTNINIPFGPYRGKAGAWGIDARRAEQGVLGTACGSEHPREAGQGVHDHEGQVRSGCRMREATTWDRTTTPSTTPVIEWQSNAQVLPLVANALGCRAMGNNHARGGESATRSKVQLTALTCSHEREHKYPTPNEARHLEKLTNTRPKRGRFTMKKPRKSAFNSVSGQVRNSGDIDRVLPVPEGPVIDSEAGMTLWRQYTGARAHEHWRDLDLLVLAKMCNLELQIRELTIRLDREGPVIEGSRGPQENPLLRVVDVLEKRHLSYIRLLSLGTGSKGRDLNKSGIKAVDRDAHERTKASVVDLLAR